MAKMKVNVKMNKRALNKLSQAQKRAILMTAEQMLHEIITEAVIPFDEGTLQNVQTYINNANLNKGEVEIVHDTPYARRLYYNPQFNFDQTINANAKGEWWEHWITGSKKKRPALLFQKFYKFISGGYVK